MQLILLTPPENCDHELETIISCFEHGLEKLHLRKPNFSNKDYVVYLEKIPAVWHKHIVLHGARHLYDEMGMGGIHLNSTERLQGLAPTLNNGIPASAVSSSFHSWQEIADADVSVFGRLFISPLFDSISKNGYLAAISPGGITTTRAMLPPNSFPQIIGLGGISAANILTLKKYGYNGAAVLGAVWQSKNPLQAYIEIAEKIV